MFVFLYAHEWVMNVLKGLFSLEMWLSVLNKILK